MALRIALRERPKQVLNRRRLPSNRLRSCFVRRRLPPNRRPNMTQYMVGHFRFFFLFCRSALFCLFISPSSTGGQRLEVRIFFGRLPSHFRFFSVSQVRSRDTSHARATLDLDLACCCRITRAPNNPLSLWLLRRTGSSYLRRIRARRLALPCHGHAFWHLGHTRVTSVGQ